MKTTKTFRLLAVLLALVLGLGTICTALAEQRVPLDSLTNEQYAEWLKRVQAQNSFENLPVNQQYAYLMALENEEDAEAAIKSLTEEQINAIIAYAQAIEAAKPVPETVVFTKAGPFMPAVNVASMRRSVMRAGTEDSQGDGLNLSKTATAESGGTYKIRLEAYTTGKVTTTTTIVPVDIVLVLDQSGSMADDFDGNESRQAAMKKAVNSFIDAVYGKYNKETNADHRMAIVTFSDGASTLQGWTKVDSTGKNTLKEKINGLPNSPSGATNAGAGMEQAESLMGSAGNNPERQKVVVFFTDGVPTKNTRFHVGTANTAITAAKSMKDAGVTVYSIGIFSSANPNQLYGDCDGTVGSRWGETSILWSGDLAKVDLAAGNRFLNYVSNNFKEATEIGLESADWSIIVAKHQGWIITKNFNRTADGYYLTANDAASLNKIFQTISENIQTADISLDSTTVVKDIVSPYFNVPANADIKVYTAAYKGGNTWDDDDDDKDSGLKANITNDTVSVTGFDFNANFVTEDPKDDGTRGEKLIIEFTVTAKDGFLGGNGVATNGTNSGVYYNDGRLVKAFVVPTVNVPIKDVTVTAQDKNVYLLGEVTAEQLKNGATVKVGDVELKLDESNYGLESWQNKYVDITVEVKDKDGNVVADKISDLAGDTTYTVKVTVSPKPATSSAGSSGAAATAEEKSATANINVFKPELTFKDSTVEFKKSVLTLNSQNYADIKAYFEANNKVSVPIWKHGNTESTVVTMIGTEPTLDLTYTPESGKIVNNIVESTTDIPVKVEAKIGTADVTGNTTFVHQKCNLVDNCQWTAPTEKGNPAFLLHVINVVGDLKITKSGLNQHTYSGGVDRESAIFKVEGDGNTWYVAINADASGTGSVTLTGLKVGDYTVTELTGWTWRYTAEKAEQKVEVEGGKEKTVSFTNTHTNQQWLGGDNYANNKFGSGN